MDFNAILDIFVKILIILIILVLLFFSIIQWIPLGREGFSADSPCGTYTKLVGDTCIADDDAVIKYLQDSGFVRADSNNVLSLSLGKTIVTKPPDWVAKWASYGKYCNRTITANPTLTGPHKTIVVGGQNMCGQDYCYVNGLCVTPYLQDSWCCPDCARIRVSDGGCAGGGVCNGACGNLTKVEYPGNQYKCVQDPQMAPKCAEGTTTGNCWSPNHVNEQRRVPYVTYNNTCTEITLCDAKNGMNEFECADGCVGTQRECNKRCFPKLWKWYSMLDSRGVPVGVWQSDELWDSKDSLLYCTGDTCEYTRDLGNSPKIANCSGCTSCATVRDPQGSVATKCDNCRSCLLNLEDTQGGDCSGKTKELVCENLTQCTGCSAVTDNLFGTILDNTCTQCQIPTSGCRFYTYDPYNIQGTNVTVRPGAIRYQQ